MGYFMVHLKVAQNILKICDNIADTAAFYVGSLAPDAIMFRKGCHRSEKSSTHFCTGEESWGYYTNYKEWTENLFQKINKYAGSLNSDFLFGYFAHIITDIAYTERFWTPVRLTDNELHIGSYFNDCYEIDSRLMENIENYDNVYQTIITSQKNCIPDLFSVDDLSLLVESMFKKIYFNRKSNPKYEFNVITYNDMLDFIENTAIKITALLPNVNI